MYAEICEQAHEAIQRFPKAVATLGKDANVWLTFFDFPAEHWKHLCTSNGDRVAVCDGAAAPARDEGRGFVDEGGLMAYKLPNMAQSRWRRLDGAHLLPLIRAGVPFVDGTI